MDWIKKHYDQFALLLLALILLAASVFIILKSVSFDDTFVATAVAPTPKEGVPPLDVAPIQEAQQKFEAPAVWRTDQTKHGPLFVSWQYYIDESGQPKRLSQTDKMPGRTVSTKFLEENGLNVRSPTVETEDPDQDGFTNLDEYLGNDRLENAPQPEDSTNPRDAKSHPPHYTKLFLKKFIRVPFRLIFLAWDGDPKNPSSLTFQINAMDLREPTMFLPVGAMVGKTKFKIEKFELKTEVNPSTGAETDVSELTMLNTENNERVVLVLNKVVNSPDSYAQFSYEWPKPPQPITVKKLQQFVLQPNTQEFFKLIDIKETEAVIQLPSGGQYIVPQLK